MRDGPALTRGDVVGDAAGTGIDRADGNSVRIALPRGVTCETELVAMARYARRLEANATSRLAREGVPDAEIEAARKKAPEDFGVGKMIERLLSGPEGQSSEG